MDANLSHFFNGIGMPLLEGYGMTETCGPVCVSLPENNRIGTIGMPMSGAPRVSRTTANCAYAAIWSAADTTTIPM